MAGWNKFMSLPWIFLRPQFSENLLSDIYMTNTACQWEHKQFKTNKSQLRHWRQMNPSSDKQPCEQWTIQWVQLTLECTHSLMDWAKANYQPAKWQIAQWQWRWSPSGSLSTEKVVWASLVKWANYGLVPLGSRLRKWPMWCCLNGN